MTYRQISGLARRDGQRDANNVGAERIKRVSFEIERKQIALLQLLQPFVERRLIENGDVPVRGEHAGRLWLSWRFIRQRLLRFQIALFALQPFAVLQIGQPAFEFVTAE